MVITNCSCLLIITHCISPSHCVSHTASSPSQTARAVSPSLHLHVCRSLLLPPLHSFHTASLTLHSSNCVALALHLTCAYSTSSRTLSLALLCLRCSSHTLPLSSASFTPPNPLQDDCNGSPIALLTCLHTNGASVSGLHFCFIESLKLSLYCPSYITSYTLCLSYCLFSFLTQTWWQGGCTC